MRPIECLHLHRQIPMPVVLAQHLPAVCTGDLPGSSSDLLVPQPLTYTENPERWGSVSELVHKSPWKCMRTPKSSWQGARLKPSRVSLGCGALLDCWSGSLELVLTLHHTDENPRYINFDVWNNTLSHMLFQAGLANPNYCEGSKWFWSRLTIYIYSSFIAILSHFQWLQLVSLGWKS